MQEAFALLEGADTSQKRDILHGLIQQLMPGMALWSHHPDEEVLFEHICCYLKQSEKLDSIPMLEYYLHFTETLYHEKIEQQAENAQDFFHLISSKKEAIYPIKERMSKFYFYALNLFTFYGDEKYDNLKETILVNSKNILENNMVSHEVKMRAYVN